MQGVESRVQGLGHEHHGVGSEGGEKEDSLRYINSVQAPSPLTCQGLGFRMLRDREV